MFEFVLNILVLFLFVERFEREGIVMFEFVLNILMLFLFVKLYYEELIIEHSNLI